MGARGRRVGGSLAAEPPDGRQFWPVEDRTAVVVAHRLSTVEDTDRVVVADGEITGTGTPDDVLAADGEDATLWRAQADAEAEADD